MYELALVAPKSEPVFLYYYPDFYYISLPFSLFTRDKKARATCCTDYRITKKE
jgi:hypothetical protein